MRNLKIGDAVSTSKIFNQEEVLTYLKLSGDSNPIHFNESYAANTTFKHCIVPGILVGSLFGGLLGSKLPGKDTIHLGQTMRFVNPVYVDEEIKATIEIVNIRSDKPIVTLKTTIYKKNGSLAIEGEAVVKYETLSQ